MRESVLRLEDDPNGGDKKQRVFMMRICAQIPSYPEARFPGAASRTDDPPNPNSGL